MATGRTSRTNRGAKSGAAAAIAKRSKDADAQTSPKGKPTGGKPAAGTPAGKEAKPFGQRPKGKSVADSPVGSGQETAVKESLPSRARKAVVAVGGSAIGALSAAASLVRPAPRGKK